MIFVTTPKSPPTEFNAYDGWRVSPQFAVDEDLDGLIVRMELQSDGEAMPGYSREVFRTDSVDDESYGRQAAAAAFWQGVCHLLNTGHDLRPAKAAFDSFIDSFGDSMPVVCPDGHYFSGMDFANEPDVTPAVTYFFRSHLNSQQVLVWEPDAYVELTTLTALHSHEDELSDQKDLLDQEGPGDEEDYL